MRHYHYISICKAYVSAREISVEISYFRPDIFLEAARRLGKDATKCLVFPGTDGGARDDVTPNWRLENIGLSENMVYSQL